MEVQSSQDVYEQNEEEVKVDDMPELIDLQILENQNQLTLDELFDSSADYDSSDEGSSVPASLSDDSTIEAYQKSSINHSSDPVDLNVSQEDNLTGKRTSKR